MKKDIKIAYFSYNTKKDDVLAYNGIVLDNYCIKCETEESLNTGGYTLDATFLLDVQKTIKDSGSATEGIREEGILKVKLDYGDEIFRISKVTKGTKYIDVVARQITISETLNLYLDGTSIQAKNISEALNKLYTNSYGNKNLELTTNLIGTVSCEYKDMSLYKALQGDQDSFINKVQGEIQRRNYKLEVLDQVGKNGTIVTIREGKNLTGFNGTSDFESVVTRARGIGANGIKGSWIQSSNISKYAMVYSKTVSYDDVKVRTKDEIQKNEATDGYDTDVEAVAELDGRVKKLFDEQQIDIPKVSYEINFVQLEKTEEYKSYAIAERVDIGNTVRVYVPKLDTDIMVRAVVKKYDVLAQRTKELTLSNEVETKAMSMNISSIVADLKKQYASSGSSSINEYMTSVIKSGMKDSYVVIRDNELLIMDNPDINVAKKVCRYNQNGLAFAQDGYYGTYTTGITIGGIINADLIRTGKLSSADGSISIDLSNNEFNIKNPNEKIKDGLTADNKGNLTITGAFMQFDEYGNKSIDIHDNKINVYDYKRNGDFIGSLMSETTEGDTYGRLVLCSHTGNPLDLGIFNSNGTYSKYITLRDNADELATITMQQWCDFKSAITISAGDVAYGFMKLDENKDLWLCSNADDSQSLKLGNRRFNGELRNVIEISATGGGANSAVTINGALNISQGKNRIVETNGYGVVALGAYETTEPYFGDIGEGIIAEDGLCYISIDPIFMKTVNTSCSYQVFLQRYGEGDVYILERAEDYFIVKGTPGLNFGWEIKAKQREYENNRLEVSDKFESVVENFDDELLDENIISDKELDGILEGEEIIYE